LKRGDWKFLAARIYNKALVLDSRAVFGFLGFVKKTLKKHSKKFGGVDLRVVPLRSQNGRTNTEAVGSGGFGKKAR
jgi:hypothetical protein